VERSAAGSDSRTFICTVVFVDLVGYSQHRVSQQVALKRHLNESVTRSLAHVAESDRLTVDTGDGVAVCFFGDPEDAMFAAAHLGEAMRADDSSGGRVRIGINLGPVRVVRDLNGNRNVIGDGINVAQRVMSFAAPNQILVSRSYYEVISHISEEYARLFQYAGLHRDKHIREHEVYEVNVAAGPGAVRADSAGVPEAGPEGAPPAVSRRSTVFPPEWLERVGASLARHIGPVSRLVVKRAAESARDTDQLLTRVAEGLAGPVREAFLAEVGQLSAPGAPRATPPEGPVAAPDRQPRGAEPISGELRASAEEYLVRYLGPIAKALVARALRDAPNAGSLTERLAQHISEPAARAAFVAAMDRAIRLPGAGDA
jgi:class 3 adenylate cyclase